MANKSKKEGQERKIRPAQSQRQQPGRGVYVFLASADASYMTGQILHPTGGEIING